VVGFLAFLIVVALGAWIFGKWGSEIASGRARILSLVTAVALAGISGKVFLVTAIARANPAAVIFKTGGLEFNGKIPWQPFSEENVAAVRKERKPGFIDFTADW
jgi:thiol:disulfide interchange protein